MYKNQIVFELCTTNNINQLLFIKEYAEDDDG